MVNLTISLLRRFELSLSALQKKKENKGCLTVVVTSSVRQTIGCLDHGGVDIDDQSGDDLDDHNDDDLDDKDGDGLDDQNGDDLDANDDHVDHEDEE